MNADHALEKLRAGNRLFVAATENSQPLISNIRRAELALEQKPFAIVLGCSDARVPAELVFSQGMGDLFVIRVAGNVVAPSQIGSVEFACQQFGTELVVVLGHQNCGAISATVDSLLGDPDAISPNIAAIVDRVTPAVHSIVAGHLPEEREELLHKAMRANVEQSVQGLQMRSRIIRGLIGQNRLKVVGAEYSIESGVVKFYE
jgi:carbonic anhydrase